jgi:hypothetical protein
MIPKISEKESKKEFTMCDAQCADEYCVRIYSEAKMKHKARVSRFLFVSNLFPSIFSLNTNLGFRYFGFFKQKTNERKSLEKRLLCCAMMMMTLMTTTTLRKEDEHCCA